MSGPTIAPELRTWLRDRGQEDCMCPWKWQSLGVLYGISMGKGWVRQTDDPACRHHGRPTTDTEEGTT